MKESVLDCSSSYLVLSRLQAGDPSAVFVTAGEPGRRRGGSSVGNGTIRHLDTRRLLGPKLSAREAFLVNNPVSPTGVVVRGCSAPISGLAFSHRMRISAEWRNSFAPAGLGSAAPHLAL